MYKYKLQKNKRKGTCPECKHTACFRYYEGLPEEYGRCDRTNNCGYHNKPNRVSAAAHQPKEHIIVQEIVQIFVDEQRVIPMLEDTSSPFHEWAGGLGIPLTHLRRWGVGTEGKNTVIVMRGADERVWNMKTIQYGPDGKRKGNIKSLKQPDPAPEAKVREHYAIPLYGVNLLRPTANGVTVCIVESEKTAIIAAHFYPQYDWVAANGSQGLTREKAQELRGRTVWNLRDADLAGRSTCSKVKLAACGTPLQCAKCRVPAIEKALANCGIDHFYIDIAPDRTDGYDLADAIAEGKRPYLPDMVQASEYAIEIAASQEANADEIAAATLGLPDVAALKCWREFGFYSHKKCYYFMSVDKGRQQVSNFIIEVLFFVPGTNGKRILRLTNEHGRQKIVDFGFRELSSLQEFNLRLEESGHFLFTGNMGHLARIKNKLYAAECEAILVEQPGMFHGKLWAWANGIFRDGKFYPVNEYGMVELPVAPMPSDMGISNPAATPPPAPSEWFYLPFLQQERYENESHMQHLPQQDPIEFGMWASQFAKVYGQEKAMVSIGFFLIAVYRDIIFQATRCTPMLFLSGQKSSGKGTMADSILRLFGQPAPQFMLGGKSTAVAMMRMMAQRQNAIVWFDEYKNGIDNRLIESLKNIWDGAATIQGQKSNDNSTRTTKILSAAMVSGQDIPVSEPAFLSRLILLTFKANPKFSAQQTADYETLKAMQQKGLTHITNQVFQLRPRVEREFLNLYAEYSATLKLSLREKYGSIEERQYVNYAILMTVLHIVGKEFPMPMSQSNLLEAVYAIMVEQNKFAGTANEVQQFWNVIAFLMQSRGIVENRDYLYKDNYIVIRMKVVYPVYREASRRQDLRPMDEGTLDSYLRDCEAYAAAMTKDAATGRPRSYCFSAFGPTNRTTGMAFDVEKVDAIYGIDLPKFRPPILAGQTTVAYETSPQTTETTENGVSEYVKWGEISTDGSVLPF